LAVHWQGETVVAADVVFRVGGARVVLDASVPSWSGITEEHSLEIHADVDVEEGPRLLDVLVVRNGKKRSVLSRLPSDVYAYIAVVVYDEFVGAGQGMHEETRQARAF
jgi:hypothetical protein